LCLSHCRRCVCRCELPGKHTGLSGNGCFTNCNGKRAGLAWLPLMRRRGPDLRSFVSRFSQSFMLNLPIINTHVAQTQKTSALPRRHAQKVSESFRKISGQRRSSESACESCLSQKGQTKRGKHRSPLHGCGRLKFQISWNRRTAEHGSLSGGWRPNHLARSPSLFKTQAQPVPPGGLVPRMWRIVGAAYQSVNLIKGAWHCAAKGAPTHARKMLLHRGKLSPAFRFGLRYSARATANPAGAQA
jgi:hypothetical protein